MPRLTTWQAAARNAHPTPEARFATIYYAERYAELECAGPMTFWDSLPAAEKRFCGDAVRQILIAAVDRERVIDG